MRDGCIRRLPERPTTTTTAIKMQVFMFRYERVNSTRKFTIFVEIVSLLKKIYKRDAPFIACEYSRLSFARVTTCESRRVTLRDSHVVAGANERRLYSQATPFRAVLKVKTLAVLFPPYPREMKTNTAI